MVVSMGLTREPFYNLCKPPKKIFRTFTGGEFITNSGYVLNAAGGVIKGSKEQLLIQSSTMADKSFVIFPDTGKKEVSTCYYEFAQRFEQKDGLLYQGFVPESADKIFESTNTGVTHD